jgi:hypothetical protein
MSEMGNFRKPFHKDPFLEHRLLSHVTIAVHGLLKRPIFGHGASRQVNEMAT